MSEAGAPRAQAGELYAALAAIGFGSAYVATAFALESFAPLPVAIYRSVIAALAIGLVISLRRRRAGGTQSDAGGAVVPWSRRRASRLLLIATLGGPVFLACMNLAVAGVGATIAAFVAGLYAVLAAVIAPALLPERLAPRVLLGFLLALLGTALLAQLGNARAGATGIGWGLAAAVSYALYLVLARRWSAANHLDGLTIALTTTSLTSVALGAIVLVIDRASLVPPSATPTALAAVVWLAAVAAVAQVLTVASVRRIPAARSAAFLLLNPISATVLGIVLLAEWPSPTQAIGGLLVLLGIAVATLPASRRPLVVPSERR